MPKCKVCGQETMKSRQICKGCYSLIKVAKNKTKSSNTNFSRANKHISANPGLLSISWPSFTKKL